MSADTSTEGVEGMAVATIRLGYGTEIAALLRALVAERDALKAKYERRVKIFDAAERDAERYRWLRESGSRESSEKVVEYFDGKKVREHSLCFFLPHEIKTRGCCGVYGLDENGRRDCGHCSRFADAQAHALDAAIDAAIAARSEAKP